MPPTICARSFGICLRTPALRMIKHNPVIGTKRLKVDRRGFHTWTDAEIARYGAHWPLATRQRHCLELALETTSRRSDITLIGPQHRRGNVLDLRHTKTESEAFMPLTGARSLSTPWRRSSI